MPIIPNVQNIVGQGLAPAARDSIGRTQERLRNGRRAWKTSPAAVRGKPRPYNGGIRKPPPACHSEEPLTKRREDALCTLYSALQ